MINWHIVCDFDGTITPTDVIDNVLQRFAGPEWETIEQEWLDGHIGSRECLSRQLALIKATPAELLAYFDSVEIDGLPGLCRSRHGPGCLDRSGQRRHRAGHCPHPFAQLRDLVADPRQPPAPGRPGQLAHRLPYASDACRAASGNCKCKSTPRNKRVLVIGDGKSDMCVASTADFVFAKGSLADYCVAHQIPHARFDTFAQVPALLAKLPQGLAANATTFNTSSDHQELFHHV